MHDWVTQWIRVLGCYKIPVQLNEGLKVFVDTQLAVSVLAVYPVLQANVHVPAPTSIPLSQVMLALAWFAMLGLAQC